MLKRLLAFLRRRKPAPAVDPLVAELHAIEARIGPDRIRLAAALLMSEGWPMSPPPPAMAWKLAYQRVEAAYPLPGAAAVPPAPPGVTIQ